MVDKANLRHTCSVLFYFHKIMYLIVYKINIDFQYLKEIKTESLENRKVLQNPPDKLELHKRNTKYPASGIMSVTG